MAAARGNNATGAAGAAIPGPPTPESTRPRRPLRKARRRNSGAAPRAPPRARERPVGRPRRRSSAAARGAAGPAESRSQGDEEEQCESRRHNSTVLPAGGVRQWGGRFIRLARSVQKLAPSDTGLGENTAQSGGLNRCVVWHNQAIRAAAEPRPPHGDVSPFAQYPESELTEGRHHPLRRL